MSRRPLPSLRKMVIVSKRYPPEVREKALRLALDHLDVYPSTCAARHFDTQFVVLLRCCGTTTGRQLLVDVGRGRRSSGTAEVLAGVLDLSVLNTLHSNTFNTYQRLSLTLIRQPDAQGKARFALSEGADNGPGSGGHD